jgi:hypothetical protein
MDLEQDQKNNMKENKFEFGDKARLKKKFGTNAGKIGIVVNINKKTYQLSFDGKLDPWFWNECDLKNYTIKKYNFFNFLTYSKKIKLN